METQSVQDAQPTGVTQKNVTNPNGVVKGTLLDNVSGFTNRLSDVLRAGTAQHKAGVALTELLQQDNGVLTDALANLRVANAEYQRVQNLLVINGQ